MAAQTRYGDRDISLILLDTAHDVGDSVSYKTPRNDFDLVLNFPHLTRLPGLRFDFNRAGMDAMIAGAFWQLLAFFRTNEGSLRDIQHSLARRLRHYFTQVVHLIQRRGTAIILRVGFVAELNKVLGSEPYVVPDQQFWHTQRDPLSFHMALIKIFLRARMAFLVEPVETIIETANSGVCMELTNLLDNLTITLQGRKIRFQGFQEADSDSIEAQSPLSSCTTNSSAFPTPTTSTAPSEDLDRVPRWDTESSKPSIGGDVEPKQASPESQQDEQVEQRATDSSAEILRLEESLASLRQSLKGQLFASQKQNAELRAKSRIRDRELAECRRANERLWQALREKKNEELREQGISGMQWDLEDMDAFLEDLAEGHN